MSEIRITVERRKPDVRFGKPDEKASGFRISGYRTSGSIQSCPVIGRPVVINLSGYRTDSKSGQYCPDFERLNRMMELYSTGRPITGQYCPDFRRSST